MKAYFFLLTVGVIGTVVYFKNTKVQVIDAKVVEYNEINKAEFRKLKALVNDKKKVQNVTTYETKSQVTGAEKFSSEVTDIFAMMKSKQMLYRYEFFNAMKPFSVRASNLTIENVDDFKNDLQDSTARVVSAIKSLHFSDDVKNEVIARVGSLINVVNVIETRVAIQKSAPLTFDDVSKGLDQLERTKSIRLHGRETVQYPNPFYLVFVWGVVTLAGFAYAAKNGNRKVAEKSLDAEEKVNPTLKKILSELDYPLYLVDQNLNTVWKNKVGAEIELSSQKAQEIFANAQEEKISVNLNNKNYNVIISDLNYKNGKKNHLIQCKPQIVSNKNLEHIIDSFEMEAMLEGALKRGNTTFGDVNQSLALMSVKLGYLFKVSGKYIDVDFKKDMSDCFIEKERLDNLVKEFILSCHYMIKDNSESEGLFFRTNELANKFTVSCFLENYKVDTLKTHPMAKDFLRRFSVMEAKYSACKPTIDFKIIQNQEVNGLDITVSFENQSELESVISNVTASA